MIQYVVKVKNTGQTTYLWGGSQVTHKLNSSLVLTIRVIEMGEVINFGISHEEKTDAKGVKYKDTPLGKLNENQLFTIPLNGIKGVYAQCQDPTLDTKVECFIESLQVNGLVSELEKIEEE
jgi:hypothetical protein